MLLQGKKKRRNLKDLKFLNTGDKFMFGIDLSLVDNAIIKKLGFSIPIVHGEKILPSGEFGTQSNFNSNGKYIKRKDLPMETWYKEIQWEWKEWSGRVHSEIRYRPYKRYPLELQKGDNFEFITYFKGGKKLILLDKEFIFDENKKEILRALNLFSEIFGNVEIFNENLDSYKNLTYKRLNWEILPSGDTPFEKLDKIIEKKYSSRKEQYPIKQRQKFFKTLKPDLVATGKGGFSGYVIYIFKEKGLAFLESIYYGNAIYVFGNDWIELSKKTKKEILDNGLEKERIIHQKNYYSEVRKYFSN